VVTQRRHILLLLFKGFDSAVLAASFLVASVLTSDDLGLSSLDEFLAIRISVRNFVLFGVLLFAWHVLFSSFGLYRSKRLSRKGVEAINVSKATTLATAILFLVGGLFHLSMIHPLFLFLFWSMTTITAVVSRFVLRFALQQIRLRGRNVRYILIIGTNRRAVQFAESLQANSALGYHVLGFVDRDWPGLNEFRNSGGSLTCDFDGFLGYIRNNVVDEVVIILPIKSFYPEASRIATICEEQGITTHFLSDLFALKRARPMADPSNEDSLITLPSRPPRAMALVVKRVMDIVLSFLCLIPCAPIFLIAAVLIKITSRGPVWFVQTRVGLNKRPFSVYKFRTMVVDAEQRQIEVEPMNEARGPVFKITNDPRITTIGRFLRKSSIDELPQLLNVLKGDMSLVGPRPLPLRDHRGFNKDWQRRRFSIRPGITCLWQVSGRSTIQFDRWMELDMEYIDRWSVWLDLQILARTIPAVLRGSGAS
jgi:exopolysaccharide biosynthesis polyprenyl glycosylphosphotransferase